MSGKDDEFRKKVRSIPDKELAKKASHWLSRLCNSGGRDFEMRVPVGVNDTDVILYEVLRRFEEAKGIK